MHRLLSLTLALTAPILAAAPALAQEAPATPGQTAFDGDWLTVGLGVVSLPSYDGSNETAVTPVPGVLGNLKGVGITPRAAGVALDLYSDDPAARVGINLGPVIRYRMNRTAHLKDPEVAKLGTLKGVLETGVQAGVTVHRVLNDFDMLALGTDVRWDTSGRNSGVAIAPALSYFTPLSPAFVAGVRVSATFVDKGYAHYNYGVTPAGSAASGLPVYQGHGGLNDWNLGGFLGWDLDNNFQNGGFAIGGGAIWSRLCGSAAETPLTALRGSRNQWFVGGGVGYTF